MNSLFERPFEEEFARQCIMYCYPELGWELELNEIDPPDLVDRIKGIGIEVTSSKPKEDNELDAVYEKYKDREESEIPPKLRKKIDKQQSGKLLFFPDESGKDVLKACYHSARIIDYHEVIARIVKKTERLNKDDYSFFKVDGLFVNDAHSFFGKRVHQTYWKKSITEQLIIADIII